MTYSFFVGIDIAAQSATVAWQQPTTGIVGQLTIEQTSVAFEQLRRRLAALDAPQRTLVVLEATSTYWMALALHLYQAGFIVSVINPARAHYFARMQLQRTKTDACDAHWLAEFARSVIPEPWNPPPAVCHQLEQRLAQRQDFLHIQTQERNRWHALTHNPDLDPAVAERTQRHLAYLAQEIAALDQEIQTLLLGKHEWSAAVRYLLTIPGIGIIVAAWILVATHNFARCDNPEEAASFAGLAPHAQDSGMSKRGKRSVGGGGHATLRQMLYMAALSATRYNPPVQQFYDHLLEQGKCKKVARCAAARKLLCIAWAVVVNERDFDPNYRSVPQSQPITA